MFDHLRYRLGEASAATVAGEWTIEQLDLNDPEQVDFRTNLIRALAVIAHHLERCKQTAAKANKELGKAAEAEKDQKEQVARRAQKNVDELEATLKGLLGIAYV